MSEERSSLREPLFYTAAAALVLAALSSGVWNLGQWTAAGQAEGSWPSLTVAHRLTAFASCCAAVFARWLWRQQLRWLAALSLAALSLGIGALSLRHPIGAGLALASTAVLSAMLPFLRSSSADAWWYWTSLGVAVVGQALRPTVAGLALLLVLGALAAVGLVEASRRSTLRAFHEKRRSTPKPLSPFIGRSREGWGAALVGALLLAVSWLAVVFGRQAYEARLGATSNERVARPAAARSSGHEALQQWMHTLSLGAGRAQRSDEVLATVALTDGRSRAPITDGRHVYFPVTTLDDFGADRMQRSAGAPPTAVLDADDGSADGWIEFERPGRGVPLLSAFVTQFTASTARGGIVPLLRLESLLAVRAAELTLLDDGTLLAGVAGPSVEFALTADARETQLRDAHGGRAHHRDPRFLALPEGDPAVERIAQIAAGIVRRQSSDASRVLHLIAHFRSSFTYSEEGTGAEGFEGLARLLERRSGYCASIAAACVVMLRTQGIPARAVAGLVGSEFDAESGLYVLRQRHGHAWVESHFAGLGWVRLEPTPADASRSVAAPREFDPLADWGESIGAGLRSFVRGESDAPRLGELAARLRDGPAALARSAQERQPLALALSGALLVALLYALGRRLFRLASRVKVARSSPGRALAFEERLIEALRRRGAQVRASWTLREISASAAAQLDPPLAASVQRAIRVLEAVRFGGAELERDQRRDLEALLEQLRPG